MKPSRGGKRPGAGRPRSRPEIHGPPKPPRRKASAQAEPHLGPKRSRGRPAGTRDTKPRKAYEYRHVASKVCANCGADFLAGKDQRKYCSAQCRVAASNAAKLSAIKTDPLRAAMESARSVIRAAFRRRGIRKQGRTVEILGCSAAEFVKHIERQFLPGMSWANRSAWHVDHIIPISSAKTPEEVVALNRMTNLRPIWASANQAKGDRVLNLI